MLKAIFKSGVVLGGAIACAILMQFGPASAGSPVLASKYASHKNIKAPVFSFGQRLTTDFALVLQISEKARSGLEPGKFTAVLTSRRSCSGTVSVLNLGTILFTFKAGECANLPNAPTSGDKLNCGFENNSNRAMACTYTRRGLIDRNVVMVKKR